MKTFFFLLSLLISWRSAFAQADSTDSGVDTIYIQGDPVVIKKEFYLPVSKAKDSASWFFTAGFGMGKNNGASGSNDVLIRYNTFSNGMISLGRRHHFWSWSAGLQYLGATGSITYKEARSYDRQTPVTYLDTIDVYTQIVQGVETKYYVTEWKDSVFHYREVKDTAGSNRFKSGYLLLPIRLNFILKKSKWFVSPGVSISPGISIAAASLVPGNVELKRKPFLLAASCHLELGRNVSDKISIGILTECTKNLTALLNQKSQAGMLLFTAGVKINFLF